MTGRVIVAGGTGFIGSVLCERLEAEGCAVTVLTRNPPPRLGERRFVGWVPGDPASSAALLAPELDGAAAVVNLAGEPVAMGRWSAPTKRRILDSRLDATRALVGAVAGTGRKPPVLVNASGVGYYGLQIDRPAAEDAPGGTGFLAEVCRRWEEEAARAQALEVRVVRLRIGFVLGVSGGGLPRMLTPFRLGLGGPLGDGTQPMSWIHIDDLAGMVLWALGEPKISGALNATAPEPVSNRVFSETLARVLGRPCLFRVPAFALRLALGELASVVLGGQNAPPRAALEGGFGFRHPGLEGALRDLLLEK